MDLTVGSLSHTMPSFRGANFPIINNKIEKYHVHLAQLKFELTANWVLHRCILMLHNAAMQEVGKYDANIQLVSGRFGSSLNNQLRCRVNSSS